MGFNSGFKGLKTFTPQSRNALRSVVEQKHYFLHSEVKIPQAISEVPKAVIQCDVM